jgi:hypothetical protein
LTYGSGFDDLRHHGDMVLKGPSHNYLEEWIVAEIMNTNKSTAP